MPCSRLTRHLYWKRDRAKRAFARRDLRSLCEFSSVLTCNAKAAVGKRNSDSGTERERIYEPVQSAGHIPRVFSFSDRRDSHECIYVLHERIHGITHIQSTCYIISWFSTPLMLFGSTDCFSFALKIHGNVCGALFDITRQWRNCTNASRNCRQDFRESDVNKKIIITCFENVSNYCVPHLMCFVCLLLSITLQLSSRIVPWFTQ